MTLFLPLTLDPIAAFFNDIVVGAVCCRTDLQSGARKLYIMTLGCLGPYRRCGVGKQAQAEADAAMPLLVHPTALAAAPDFITFPFSTRGN